VPRRRWTEAEDKRLRFVWGENDILKLAREFGRSADSVAKRAQALGLVVRPLLSLRGAAQATGYDPETLKRAARALGITLHRRHRLHAPRSRMKHPRNPNKGVTEEQLDAIVAWLKEQPTWRVTPSPIGEWGTGRKPPSCLECETTERPHVARGRCGACLAKLYRRGAMPKGTEKGVP
jgi:hypothetical protein